MESTQEETVGIAETRHRKRPCKGDGVLWRLLAMGSDKNMRGQSNFKRKAVAGGTGKLFRLLHVTSCFEVILNRRMPNSMYGGVRGEI